MNDRRISNGLALCPVRKLSLFSGCGWLDLAVKLAVPRAVALGYVEREAYAAATLVARMEDSALDPAPLWDDVTTLDCELYRGAVDLVVAGFPCPPVSVAGKRGGIDDDRWLWPEVVRVVRETQPRWIFLENVGGLLSANAGREFGEILRDLAGLGFDAEWLRLPARDVGAAHERERVFILAVRKDGGRGELRQSPGRDRQSHGRDKKLADATNPDGRSGDVGGEGFAGSTGGRSGSTSGREALAHASDDHGRGGERGAEEGARPGGLGRRGSPGGRAELADADERRQDGTQRGGPEIKSSKRRGELADPSSGEPRRESDGVGEPGEGRPDPGPGRQGLALFAPGPGDPSWPDIVADFPHLAPAVEPGLRVLVDGRSLVVDEGRADQLRLGGNGVVALQGAAALVVLDRRLGAGLVRKPAEILEGPHA